MSNANLKMRASQIKTGLLEVITCHLSHVRKNNISVKTGARQQISARDRAALQASLAPLRRDERCWDVLLCFIHSRRDLGPFLNHPPPSLPPSLAFFKSMCCVKLLHIMAFKKYKKKKEKSWAWQREKDNIPSQHSLHFPLRRRYQSESPRPPRKKQRWNLQLRTCERKN